MKFKFKKQDYQTKAVSSIIDVFKGQPYNDNVKYTRDLGIKKKGNILTNKGLDEDVTFQSGSFLKNIDSEIIVKEITEYYNDDIENSDGFGNSDLVLNDEQLLNNIKNIQSLNNINISDKLIKHLGRCSLDVEMETGTGKTYVYIKTIFELNKQYGFSKFMIVVPSIAIREGVKKTFEMTEEHFMESYHKK